MKKILAMTAAIGLTCVAFTQPAKAQISTQRSVEITVPYNLTNLDPRITSGQIMCIVKRSERDQSLGNALEALHWGEGDVKFDITPPTASGEVVVTVEKYPEGANERSLVGRNFLCIIAVAIDPDDPELGYTNFSNSSQRDYARSTADDRVRGVLVEAE